MSNAVYEKIGRRVVELLASNAQFAKAPNKDIGGKKPSCKDTSQSCGFSCISGKKVCRITMTIEQQRAAKQLKKDLGGEGKQPTLIKKPETAKPIEKSKPSNVEKSSNKGAWESSTFEKYTRAIDKIEAGIKKETDRLNELRGDWSAKAKNERVMIRGKIAPQLRKLDLEHEKFLKEAIGSRMSYGESVKALAGVSGAEGVEHLNAVVRLVGRKPETLKYVALSTERAYATAGGLISVDAKNRTSIFHEVGHHYEFSDPSLQQEMIDFRRKRSSDGDKLHDLSELIPGYVKGEVAIKDKFVTPYVGRVYEKSLATEVLSVGLEKFATPESLTEFRIRDREHYDLMIKFLKG